MAKEQVTLREVAARAGVSISSVSRVLRGDRSRPVEAATEERIRRAVRELGYRPNLAARSLARGEASAHRSEQEVGIVLGTERYKYSDPFFSRVIEGIDAEILAHHRHLRFVYSIADLEDERLFGEMVRPDVVGGLIAISVRAAVLARLSAAGITPIVVVEGPDPAPGVDFVFCDKEAAIAQMMEHLWNLGHRRFAFLGKSGEERAKRFRAWLALADLPAAPILDTRGQWSIEAGYDALQDFLTTARDGWPDAIVCGSDSLAVGALRAARDAGLTVPDDLAIVGFDDTMGAFVDPPLTSVAVQREQLGRVAVRRLIARQRYPDEPPMRIVEGVALVVRASCGAGLVDRAAGLVPLDTRARPRV